MIRVTALTSGRYVPSARFRVRQHIPGLARHGIAVTEYCPLLSQYPSLPSVLGRRVALGSFPPAAAAYQLLGCAARIPGVVAGYGCDVTWIERVFCRGLESAAMLTPRPRVVDIDDAIWLSRPQWPRGTLHLLRLADYVISGNRYIADWVAAHGVPTRVIPTAVDCDRFSPAAVDPSRFVVVWTGSTSTLRHLEAVWTPLRAFLRRHPRALLRVIADRRPQLPDVREDQIEYLAWSPVNETAGVRGAHVGIMPLPDEEWSRGKCSFKLLQYLACGVASVASPVGMNTEVLGAGERGIAANSPEQWLSSLELLWSDDALRTRLAAAGRAFVERCYSLPVVASAIAQVFREVSVVGR